MVNNVSKTTQLSRGRTSIKIQDSLVLVLHKRFGRGRESRLGVLAREGAPGSSQKSGLRSCRKPGASVSHRSSGKEQCTADREMGVARWQEVPG